MKKWLKTTLITITCLLVLTVAGTALYLSDYYRADEIAVAAMTGSSMKTQDNLAILTPTTPSETGLIFYSGGKVEHTAYLPLLEQLRQQGITCVLVEMPFHLAVFDPDASEHPDKVQGLVLLGAYLYGDYPAQYARTLYGSEDKVMSREKLVYTENVVEIAGGNHAQFCNYGVQKGDGTATVSAAVQQA